MLSADSVMYFSRPKWEGGQYDGDEKTRLDALRLVMELGADYIDVELQVALFQMYHFKSFMLFAMVGPSLV